MNQAAKLAAATAAAALVEDGMVLGLGTGSTMRLVLAAIAGRVRAEGLRLTGLATSQATAAQATALGIRLAEPDAPADLALDGADEIERGSLRLLKGGGGALLREKIVAESARRFVVVADDGKLVDCLGATMGLPVEVAAFGHAATARRLAALGAAPELRQAGGEPFRTDGGNPIYDCPGFGRLSDPYTLERQLRAIAGVLGTGLFLLPVERAIIGGADGCVLELRP
jgi:ribose 5-phosphate isomerase A